MNKETEFEITMPHRHTIIYRSGAQEILFEIEVSQREAVVWLQSAKCNQDGKTSFELEAGRVKSWLEKKFKGKKAIIDER